MRRIPFVLLALCMLAAPAAHAAPPEIVDVAGDATGINGQGVSGLEAIDRSAPQPGKQLESLDIVSVRFGLEKVRKSLRYVTVTMTLSGDPNAEPTPHKYVVYFNSRTCNATSTLEWHSTPSVDGAPDYVEPPVPAGDVDRVYVWTRGAQLTRGGCVEPTRTVALPASRVKGKTIVWRIPAAHAWPKGSVLKDFVAQSRARFRASGYYTYPVWDQAASTRTFRIA